MDTHHALKGTGYYPSRLALGKVSNGLQSYSFIQEIISLLQMASRARCLISVR
jgi:hypothetical protein